MMLWGKALGWFNLALLGVVSYASAAVGMQILEQALEEAIPPPTVATQHQGAVSRKARLALSEFQPIFDANMFRAKRSNKRPAPTGPVSPSSDGGPPVPSAPATLDVVLQGTVVSGNNSFALVAESSGRNQKVYRRKECLPGGESHPSRTCEPNQGTLVSIRKKHIVVEYQGQRQTIKLTDKSDKPAPATAQRPSSKTKAAPSASGGTAFPITREGNELEVRVPQAEVAQAFENFSDVLKQARVVPYTGADYSGFQIRSIRSGSIFQRIGLQNFDVIKSVNGQPITTADQALRLLTMFRNETEISMDLHRRNEPLKLHYIIE